MQTFIFETLKQELENLKTHLSVGADDPAEVQRQIELKRAEIEVAKKEAFKYLGKIYLRIEPGCDLEIGNVIRMNSNWGKSHTQITRTTKTMAIGEKGTRFPKRYDNRFRSIPFNVWDATEYSAFSAYNPKCKQCGERYDEKETARIQGKAFTENHPGFCSARCFTQHTIKS